MFNYVFSVFVVVVVVNLIIDWYVKMSVQILL